MQKIQRLSWIFYFLTTLAKLLCINVILMSCCCQRYQRYINESNSQLDRVVPNRECRCCQRYQRYINESNSQPSLLPSIATVCCCQRYQRYINESNSQPPVSSLLQAVGCCQRYQRYINESNSQLKFKLKLVQIVVVSGIKDT